MVVLDMALSTSIADNPFPWTWGLDKETIAGEGAGNEPGIDIDSLDSMAAAAEDEGKARMEDCGQVEH